MQLGLTKKKQNGIYLNIKNSKIVKSSKDKDGNRFIKEEDHYDHLTGFIKDLNLVNKSISGQPYKELQITVDTPATTDEEDVKYQRYTLTYNYEKPFSTGFLLSLANADLTKQIIIGVYAKKATEPGYKPSTYCALRYAGEKELIKWIDGYPDVEIKMIDGEEIKSTKLRKDFINKTYDSLKEKLKDINIDSEIEFINENAEANEDDGLGESL
jgi:hypothetical protein